jgi:hypothetical protein
VKKNHTQTLFGIVLLTFVGTLLQAQNAAQSLAQLTGEDHVHHMLPPSKAAARTFEAFNNTPSGGGPVVGALTYHGGPVMTTAVTYAIFWTPSTLQNGAATSLSTSYENILTNFLSLYPGHSIANNNTQYYSTSGSGLFHFTNYITNTGSFGGSYVDATPYPASACSDPVTPSNCLSDAQIQAEVSKVMGIQGWSGGLNHIFFVYTGSGEGSCSSAGCAYTNYCAYHGYFNSGSTTVLYGNMPYAAAGYCQAGSAPNGAADGDAAASITSHELTEAMTDPELNAWYSATGSEIGDLCAWNYGTNTWDGGLANESWPVSLSSLYIIGHPPVYNFELQMEYSNHSASCVQVGPM